MGTALAIYEKLNYSTSEQWCTAASSYTGCSLSQSPAVLLTCALEDITLKDYARTYHNFDGKAVMKSQAMLANFRTKYGGSHRVIADTSERAAITLVAKDGGEYTYEFTAEEAIRSRWPWKKWRESLPEALKLLAAGKSAAEVRDLMVDQLKDNWGTATDWKTMLMRRAVSAAVDNFCPEVDNGTGSEWDDANVLHAEVVTAAPKRTTAAEAMALAAGQTNGAAAAIEQPTGTTVEDAEDGEFEPATDSGAPIDAAANGYATRAQIDRLHELRTDLNMPNDAWEGALKKRNATTAHGLKPADAQDLIDKLEAKRRLAAASKN